MVQTKFHGNEVTFNSGWLALQRKLKQVRGDNQNKR